MSLEQKCQANYHDLYWAQGDGGPQQDPNDHGQRTDTLFGKVVRISVPSKGSGYEIPSDNYPGAGKCQENRASRPPVVGHGLTFEYDCSN